MIDHVALPVGDLDRSRKFYEQALEPLGREVMMEWPGGVLYTLGGGGMLALRQQRPGDADSPGLRSRPDGRQRLP